MQQTTTRERVIEGELHVADDPAAQPLQRVHPAERSRDGGSQATSLIEAIAKAGANPKTDMDKMERLFAMHQKMVAQEAEAAFNAAMARAQANMVPVVTNKTNTHTNSKYADLGAIAKAITPIYTAEGLSISFDANAPVVDKTGAPLEAPPSGWFRTVALVSHSAGHSRIHHIDLPSDETGAKGNTNKTPIQGVISTTTYSRRVLTCMVFNIAITDSDGNAGKSTGITLSSYTDLLTAFEAATTVEAVTGAWQASVRACEQAKDWDAYEKLKKVASERKTALKGAK